MLKLLRQASRPRDAVLGMVDGDDETYAATLEDGGKTIAGLIIYRFEASLFFFNADYFTERVRTVISNADAKPRRFLFDAESVPMLDVSGAYALDALRSELAGQGIVFGIARARGSLADILRSSCAYHGLTTPGIPHGSPGESRVVPISPIPAAWL